MKHTNGPWIFRDCTPDFTDGKYEGLRFEIWADTLDYHIANTTDGARQAEANARLIAASPELLEYAELALNLLYSEDAKRGYCTRAGDVSNWAKARDGLREAINKAKGVI